MRNHRAPEHPPDVLYFPLGTGSDALALSRFAHQVVDQDLCGVKAVVVEVKKDSIASPSTCDLLNMAVGRMARRHLFVVILVVDQATMARIRPATFSNLDLVHLAGREADVALLLLNNTRSTT